jgi:hypothetical protein
MLNHSLACINQKLFSLSITIFQSKRWQKIKIFYQLEFGINNFIKVNVFLPILLHLMVQPHLD